MRLPAELFDLLDNLGNSVLVSWSLTHDEVRETIDAMFEADENEDALRDRLIERLVKAQFAAGFGSLPEYVREAAKNWSPSSGQ
jgi:hypothetical protein